MENSYIHLEADELQAILLTYKQNLAHLEQQKAKYGDINTPLPIFNEIRSTQENINAIILELKNRGMYHISNKDISNSSIHINSQQYIDAAEAHRKIGNKDLAIQYLTKAIDIFPKSNIFLLRSEVYQEMGFKFIDLALSDLNNAVKLSNTIELEKLARITRIKFLSEWDEKHHNDIWNEDVSRLNTILTGKDLGELLFFRLVRLQDYHLFHAQEKYVIDVTSECINYGYIESEIYYYRCRAFYGLHNIKCALGDIDNAINLSNNTQELANYKSIKGSLLGYSNNFIESYNEYSQIYGINGVDYIQFLILDSISPEETDSTIFQWICKFALDYKFNFNILYGLDSKQAVEVIKNFIKFYPKLLDYISTKAPPIKPIIEEMLSDYQE